MHTPLQADAIAETYNDVELLIKHTVAGFIRKNGTRWGDFDELFAQANYEFMTAYDKYKPNRGASFSTWCRWVVSKGLLEKQRTAIHRQRNCRVDIVDTTEMDFSQSDRTHVMVDMIDCLGPDAEYVVMLTLNPPTGLQQCLSEVRGNKPKNQQTVIRQYLHGLEWDDKRIDQTFEEISDVLVQ